MAVKNNRSPSFAFVLPMHSDVMFAQEEVVA